MNDSSSTKNNVSGWLAQSTSKLLAIGIESARLDCLLLLEMVLNTNRTQLLANPEQNISREQNSGLERLLKRRLSHEPMAYIRGKCEFYGREFLVDINVLVPRPETETMIELLLKLTLKQPRTLIDVGTGSGTLAITAACELGEALVFATDISEACLSVARRNAVKHKATINFKQTDLVEGIDTTDSLILANLPYVPFSHPINQAAGFEPPLALYGGNDGLDLYRQLFVQLKGQPPTYILTEALPSQHKSLMALAKQHGFNELLREGYVQVFTCQEQG